MNRHAPKQRTKRKIGECNIDLQISELTRRLDECAKQLRELGVTDADKITANCVDIIGIIIGPLEERLDDLSRVAVAK